MLTYCSFLFISIYGGGTEIIATPDSVLTATPRLGKNAAREIQERTASLFTSENPAAPATMSKIFPRGKRKKKRPRLGAWGKREFEERTGVLTGHNCSHAVSYKILPYPPSLPLPRYPVLPALCGPVYPPCRESPCFPSLPLLPVSLCISMVNPCITFQSLLYGKAVWTLCRAFSLHSMFC